MVVTYKEIAQTTPCQTACPVELDVPLYVRLIAEGKFDEALAVVRQKLPFPSVCGRVCVHLCEDECQARHLGAPVAIRALKRFIAERPGAAVKESPPNKSTGKAVAIVGSGPAGLTAAYYLAKLGHAVTVFEAQSQPGGLLRWGIPTYDLPPNIVDQEIDNILGIGVELKLNTPVTNAADLIKEYDAVFLAPGLAAGRKLPIPGADLKNVLTGIELLRDINAGKKVSFARKKVLVLGGGGVAFDVARSARRLGAAEVHLACLESRSTMPALPEIIEEAEKEGVILHPSRCFTRIVSKNRRVTGVECVNLRWMKFDKEGGLHMETIPGSEHVLEADVVVFAVGQAIDVSLISDIPEIELNKNGTISVNTETMATGRKGVFAGGDIVAGPASIIEAIAAGRKAAIAIDRYLGGTGDIDVKLAPAEKPVQTDLQGFPVAPRTPIPSLPVKERLKGFAAVELGLTEEQAISEAKRCLRCNLPITIDAENCVGCLTCVMRCALKYGNAFSPARSQIAVIPIIEGVNIISFRDECDTCGICARYCPHDALYRGERRPAKVAAK